MKYPLLLNPVLKDYIWGGKRLLNEYGFKASSETVAEGWMLSCHKDGTNTVANGKYKGKTLDAVLKEWGYNGLPVIIKLIDANDRLSVQVHPDNEYALKHEGESGKTEMWYVVDACPDAQLAYGFNKDISRDEFKKRITENSLDDVINYVSVKKGDVFFIPAGTLHAIGKGILIAEIQQNSNSTYRVSDYGRIGHDGKPRELHIDKAVDVTKTEKQTTESQKETVCRFDYGTERLLSECEYFKAVKIDLNGQKDIDLKSGLADILVLSGEITVQSQNGSFKAKKGDSVFVPNDCVCEINGKAEMIYTTF